MFKVLQFMNRGKCRGCKDFGVWNCDFGFQLFTLSEALNRQELKFFVHS